MLLGKFCCFNILSIHRISCIELCPSNEISINIKIFAFQLEPVFNEKNNFKTDPEQGICALVLNILNYCQWTSGYNKERIKMATSTQAEEIGEGEINLDLVAASLADEDKRFEQSRFGLSWTHYLLVLNTSLAICQLACALTQLSLGTLFYHVSSNLIFCVIKKIEN